MNKFEKYFDARGNPLKENAFYEIRYSEQIWYLEQQEGNPILRNWNNSVKIDLSKVPTERTYPLKNPRANAERYDRSWMKKILDEQRGRN